MTMEPAPNQSSEFSELPPLPSARARDSPLHPSPSPRLGSPRYGGGTLAPEARVPEQQTTSYFLQASNFAATTTKDANLMDASAGGSFGIDTVYKMRLESVEQKLQRLLEMPSSTQAVFELTKRISDRTNESARQQREYDTYFKQAMEKFGNVENRLVEVEKRLQQDLKQAVVTINRESLRTTRLEANLEEEKQVIRHDKDARAKAEGQISEDMQNLINTFITRLDESEAQLVRYKDEIQEFCKKDNDEVRKNVIDLFEAVGGVREIVESAQKQQNAKIDAANKKVKEQLTQKCTQFHEDILGKISSIWQSQKDVDEQIKNHDTQTNIRITELEKKADSCMDKLYEHITLVRDDVDLMASKQRQHNEILTGELRSLEKRTIEHQQAINMKHMVDTDERLEQINETIKENETSFAKMDARIEALKEILEERVGNLNQTVGAALGENESLRAQCLAWNKENEQLSEKLLQLQEVTSYKYNHMGLIQKQHADQTMNLSQALQDLSRKTDQLKNDTVEKSKLGAMSISESIVRQHDHAIRQDVGVLCYWVQQCCEKLQMKPKGVLSIPKQANTVGRRTQSPSNSPAPSPAPLGDNKMRGEELQIDLSKVNGSTEVPMVKRVSKSNGSGRRTTRSTTVDENYANVDAHSNDDVNAAAVPPDDDYTSNSRSVNSQDNEHDHHHQQEPRSVEDHSHHRTTDTEMLRQLFGNFAPPSRGAQHGELSSSGASRVRGKSIPSSNRISTTRQKKNTTVLTGGSGCANCCGSARIRKSVNMSSGNGVDDARLAQARRSIPFPFSSASSQPIPVSSRHTSSGAGMSSLRAMSAPRKTKRLSSK